MNSKPSISIITVCFNSEATIRRTLESLKGQTDADFDLIIIDGKSTDNTLTIIREYNGLVSTLVSEPDNGIYDAMNKGVKLAAGDYVAFLNSDDAYLPETIGKIRESAAQKPDVIYGNIRKERRLGNEVLSRIEKPFLDKMPETMGVFHPATFVKRSLFDKIGLFDTRFSLAADYHWFLKIYLEGVNFKYIDEILTVFSVGGATNFSCDTYREAIEIQRECNTGNHLKMEELYRQCLEKQKRQKVISRLSRLPLFKEIYHHQIKKRWS